jgi:DNA (cytosine-5)-methyltransferase 1
MTGSARLMQVVEEGDATGRNLTVQEAAILQSYPADFEFAGSKTKRFLQVGNAVPPVFGRAVIEAVLEGAAEYSLAA